MSYFERSMEVGRRLRGNREVVGNVRRALRGESQPFSCGSTAELYQIGKSGEVYVALRRFDPRGSYGRADLKFQSGLMEVYCLNAEDLDAKGKRVPDFCVGVVCDEQAAILTEDLTQGGQRKVDHSKGGEAAGYILVDGKKTLVYIDIDHGFDNRDFDVLDFIRGGVPLKYFSDENAIKLD